MKRMSVLKIEEIVFDKSIYPRTNTWWGTSYRYSEMMKAGAKFPPIIVGKLDGKYILVDGKHRLEAYQKLGQKHVSCEVLTDLTKKELFVKAIELNVAHGQTLSSYDKVRIVEALKKMDYSMPQIAKIVQIPADKITQFVATRMTVNPAGEQMILKASLRHLSDKQVPVAEYQQTDLSGRSQFQMVNQLIQIFKYEQLARVDKDFIETVETLYKLIGEFLERNS